MLLSLLTIASWLANAGVSSLATNSSGASILRSAGAQAVIQGWHIQSSKNTSSSVSSLSHTGIDTSTWIRVGARGSVFAGLLGSGIYDDTKLFFSNSLEQVDYTAYEVPWLYREEFMLVRQPSQHYFLQTHGITSRADIYVNGVQITSNQTQVGSYGGHEYDITKALTDGNNAILIVAYPTNYLRDFAMGYVDWNPYPPDNGTGVWRYVEMAQTGPVALSTPRFKTDFEYLWMNSTTVIVRIDAANNENRTISSNVTATFQNPDGSYLDTVSQQISIGAGQTKTASLMIDVPRPQVWWPAQWGSQPLYTVSVSAFVSDVLSDATPTRKFSIRHVSSYVNSYNDTAFTINGHPFLVMGAGYAPDLFYRFDINRTRRQFQRVLDMGLNTIRLEGKQEHPELYDIADEMGLMILPGWECCDKWEGWAYNDEVEDVPLWTTADYATANASMRHEASMMQTHPSILAFLVGSDFWPNDAATSIYVSALNSLDWPTPIIASAGQLGYPELLGPSGMKMLGPYDYVPPNYWYGDQLGAAFGFGSELGAGVGTPELPSLRRFLSEEDMEDLWQRPNKTLFHMSRYDSSFTDRSIYNAALFRRFGKPKSLNDYLMKAQLMDFEATRAQFEAYSAYKSHGRPSTGLIYWMLQGAWPNLHWQLFDYCESFASLCS
jgi:exo-1,4-beta-D-glucosaminidase